MEKEENNEDLEVFGFRGVIPFNGPSLIDLENLTHLSTDPFPCEGKVRVYSVTTVE